MGNVVGGSEQQEVAQGHRPSHRESKNSVSSSDPTPPTFQKKQPAPPKLPMPPEQELVERFNVVLVSHWLAVYKLEKLLCQMFLLQQKYQWPYCNIEIQVNVLMK